MPITHDGLVDPDFSETIAFHANKGLQGYYDPSKSWEVCLNMKEIRALGIYDEIFVHEHMHHQLMCSTSFGHATQFVALLARHNDSFQKLLDTLMKLSWTAHEGAAMLAGYHLHCKPSPMARELERLAQSEDEHDARRALHPERWDFAPAIRDIGQE